MSSHILAINISEVDLTAVLIATGLKGNAIETYAQFYFSDAPQDAESPLDWALVQLSEQMTVSGTFCLLSLPSTEVTYRNIKVPFKDRKKIRQVLPFELEPSLPYPIEELTLDFQVIRKTDYSDLIAAVVKTDYIKTITEKFKRHNMVPRFITSGAMAEAMSLAKHAVDPAADFLFVETTEKSATAIAVCSGNVHLVRTFNMTNDDRQQRIKRLAADLTRMTAVFETIYDFGFEPEKILVTGKDSESPELISGIQEALDISVFPVNIFEDTQLKITASSGVEIVPSLLNAPLALAGVETGGILPFNFSRQHHVLRKYWMENKREIITTALLATVVFILLMVHVGVESNRLQDQIRKVDQRIVGIFQSTFDEDEAVVDPVQQMRIKLRQVKEKSSYSAGSGKGALNIDILNDISELISSEIDVVMTRFVRDDRSLVMSGTTDTFNTVDDIKMRLEKSKYFKELTISSANMDKNLNRVRFSIKADLAGS